MCQKGEKIFIEYMPGIISTNPDYFMNDIETTD